MIHDHKLNNILLNIICVNVFTTNVSHPFINLDAIKGYNILHFSVHLKAKGIALKSVMSGKPLFTHHNKSSPLMPLYIHSNTLATGFLYSPSVHFQFYADDVQVCATADRSD